MFGSTEQNDSAGRVSVRHMGVKQIGGHVVLFRLSDKIRGSKTVYDLHWIGSILQFTCRRSGSQLACCALLRGFDRCRHWAHLGLSNDVAHL